MSNQQNDLSLLRPFNLEAAKNGEEICWSNILAPVTFIGVNSKGRVAFESDSESMFTHKSQFRMKPLCWVEGKPVYKGDVLYGKTCPDYRYNVKGISSSGNILSEPNETQSYCEEPCNLTWNKPKQKVKRKVWINVYPYFTSSWESKDEAEKCQADHRIACVETEIEYEV